jgi:hypothetical protein
MLVVRWRFLEARMCQAKQFLEKGKEKNNLFLN